MAITIIAGTILFFVLTQNLLSIKYDQALIMSDQITVNIDSFLQSKLSSAKTIHQKLYRSTDTWNMLMNKLTEAPSDNYYAYQWREFDDTITDTIHSIDDEFKGLFFWESDKNNTLFYGTSGSTSEFNFFREYAPLYHQMSDSDIQLVRFTNTNHYNNAFSLFIVDSIRDPADFSTPIGTMGLYFNAINIKKSYEQYQKYAKGTIYVLDQNGWILFDSSSNYQLDSAFPIDRIMKNGNGSFLSQKQIYNVYHSGDQAYSIVNVFPKSAIVDDIRGLQANMLMVLVLILLLSLLLNYVSTKFFSKRVTPILETMEHIKSGNLSHLPAYKQPSDEIGYIYTQLLEMSAVLQDHIEKEYIYRLHQKEMELYTLQAQINPHFLYNSLESIRMNLYMKGEEEAGKMIRILSDLFRNTMRKDVVISIREELDYAESYLELYQFRLGKRMVYSFETDDHVYRYATVKHILQPLIENALVHGIEPTGSEEHPSAITISAALQGEDIIFSIRDDGCGIDPERLTEIREKLSEEDLFHDSIGIYNVNNRLRIVYGADYRLKIDSCTNQGTTVTLRIKAMKKKELETYVHNLNY